VASNTGKKPMPTELLVDNWPDVVIPKDLRHTWRRILPDHGRPPLMQNSARAIMYQ
jgi:hypothetical protein